MVTTVTIKKKLMINIYLKNEINEHFTVKERQAGKSGYLVCVARYCIVTSK